MSSTQINMTNNAALASAKASAVATAAAASAVASAVSALKETKKCCFCDKSYGKYGNNPYPVQANGRCCDSCNQSVVLRIRLGLIMGRFV